MLRVSPGYFPGSAFPVGCGEFQLEKLLSQTILAGFHDVVVIITIVSQTIFLELCEVGGEGILGLSLQLKK
jgi:hypothetical protein